MSRAETDARGWDYVDVVFVTGDAYVDHPSFAAAILTRVLEAEGFRVAILAQPDWRSAEPWRTFGRPRLFFAVSAGNVDSMIAHYTANKKVRNDDAYTPGGRIGKRPDRATLVYCQRAREAYPGVPIIAGGVEASLRRLAHYDYWSDRVRPSILVDSKADLVVYGMGEKPIVEIARRLSESSGVRDLRSMRGVAFLLGAKEKPPSGPGVVEIPSFEEMRDDPVAFSVATRMMHLETNPHNARTIVQRHGDRWVVQRPPSLPLAPEELDRIYELPYTRAPHPSYTEEIPAYEMVRHSIAVLRGCFGGCTFCSIAAHQGRIVQSRSPRSVLREIEALKRSPGFRGVVSDIGGPTANMYAMRCKDPKVEALCRRLSCLYPRICSFLETDHGPLIDLLRKARGTRGIRKVFVASGIRVDLAERSPEFIEELAAHHVGGHLKVAPEHSDPRVLAAMKKPPIDRFERFAAAFEKASRRAGKEQYLIPYWIASHPGSDLPAMIDLALFLKRAGFRPEQVQDFLPAPMDVAASMYHTGVDPFTLEKVPVAKKMRERRYQRALLQFFLPENYFLVREALLAAGRADLIGDGPACLIPSAPPPAVIRARRRRVASGGERRLGGKRRARRPASGGDRPPSGYRPHRKTAVRRRREPPGS